jgi:hypothetical protein
MADETSQKFYARVLKDDVKKNGKLYCDIEVLTPFDIERKPYVIRIPISNARNLFCTPREGDDSYKENPRLQEIPDYEKLGPSLLEVKDNIRFGSLEAKIHGEKDPFDFSDDPSDESGPGGFPAIENE